MKKIMVVEDDKALCNGICLALKSEELFLCLAKQKGITILLSSHILSEVEQIADRIGFIVDGIVVKEISPLEIRENYPAGLEDYFMQIVSGGKVNE